MALGMNVTHNKELPDFLFLISHVSQDIWYKLYCTQTRSMEWAGKMADGIGRRRLK